MKTWIIYIISLLLLCVSCKVEQQLDYVGFTGNNECRTVRLRIPNNWKIVNAQLKTNQLNLEFDKGRGIEKQSLPILFQIEDLSENMQFRGANRLDGLALLYFTKDEDPQNVFNPPLAKFKISKSSKEREVFAVFRASNWLMVYFSIENTDFGNLLSHNLQQKYIGDVKIDQRGAFKLVDGILHLEFGENKEKRSFPIQKFVEQHEKSNRGSGSSGFSENKLRWVGHFKMASKQK